MIRSYLARAAPYALRGGLILAVACAALIVVTTAFRFVRLDAHFPIPVLESVAPLTFLTAYPLLVASLWRRRRSLVAVGLAGIGLHLLWFGGMLPVVHGHRSLPAGATELRVLTANLLFDNPETAALATTIGRLSPDVLAFQEFTPTSSSPLLSSPQLDPYRYRLLNTRTSPDGIALLSKLPIEDPQMLTSAGRQLLRAQIITRNGPVTVFVVHTVAPVTPSGAGIWSSELRDLAPTFEHVNGPLIVAGDFNATDGNRLLDDLKRRGGLRDVFDATGSGYVMTWPANRALTPPIVRPDHVLVGRGVVPLSGKTVRDPGSDHRAVVVDLGVLSQG